MDEIYPDPEEAARARRYQMRRLGWGLASSAAEFAATAALVALGPRGGWPLPGGAPFWTGAVFWAGAAYFALLATLRAAASLPLDWVEGYVLPHSVGLSTQTPAGWWADQGKGWLLRLAIGAPAAGGLVFLMTGWPGHWWWMAALLGAALGSALALIGPVVIAPLFFRFRPLADAGLRARLEDLLRRTGARVRGGVWEMDMSRRSRGANAALVGWGPSRRVVLSDTLLAYGPDEIEAVLAHEIAHHVGRHIPLLMAGQAALGAAGLYLAQALLARPWLFAWAGIAPVAAGEPVAIGWLWLFFTLYGAAASPFVLALARRLEVWCDRFAVVHTGGAGGMASALARLCRGNRADPAPPRWVVVLFHAHPPLGERIRRVRAAARLAGG